VRARAANVAAWSLAGTGAAALVHLSPGVVAWRAARCRLLPRLSGVGDRGHVALTFDDGPDPISTPPVLDVLEQLGWQATFFCLGGQVRRSPGLARELVQRGHEVAVHGDDHRSHLLRSPRGTVDDVVRARDSIEEITQTTMTWFRPPYGGVAVPSLLAGRKAGLNMVLWTSWGIDWREDSTGRSVADNVTRTFYPGATVLLHDSDITSSPGSWRSTVEALPRLAELWADAGLRAGPLREHGIR
jgi:peptidoglycan/xylan/chitin deacetylase (PgdA/CDA1 family)